MAYNMVPERADETVGAWMLTLLVASIPLVGFIYLLVPALGSSASASKRNFARALFAWQIIAFVALILSCVIVSVGGYLMSK